MEEARDGSPLTLDHVVAFATRLCRDGSDDDADIRASGTVIGIEARLFDSCRVTAWRGVAERLHVEGTSSVWHARFFAAASAPVAIATVHMRADPALPAKAGGEVDDVEAAAQAEPKEPPSTRRREKIAAAACDVIARKGFANATMREIASAAGLHVPTMYQYVTSKDEMLELVYRWIMDSVRTDVIEAADPQQSATDQLRAVIGAIIKRGDRFRHRIGVLNRELKSLSPSARRRVITEYRGLLDQIASLIEAGVEAGEFRPVHPTVAANLVDAICDIWPLRPFAVGHVGLEAFATEVSDFVLAGLKR